MEPSQVDRTRVALLPAAHPAVRRITGLGTRDHVELVPIRPGVVSGETPPEAVTDAEQDPGDDASVEIHHDRDPLDHVDVVHVHFGYDYLVPESVEEVVDHLARTEVPMVVTVHDIVYPVEDDSRPRRAHTGTLVEAAESVVTLTEVAAQELWVRWGVEPMVVPHPRVLEEAEISAAVRDAAHLRDGPDSTVVGVVLERMGENIEGLELLDLLAPVVDGLSGTHLRIVVEAEAWRDACGEDGDHHIVAELEETGEWESVRLVRYDALEWTGVIAEFAALDVCVLPYRFGTHSSWLELCRDLGVTPVFPAVGCLQQQWFDRCDPVEHSGEVYDLREPGSLAMAVRAALDETRSIPPRVDGADPDAVMVVHEEIYRAAGR